MEPINQRKHDRFTLAIPARVLINETKVIQADIENISMGGARLRCPEPIGVGDEITLEIRFSGVKTITAKVTEQSEVQGKASADAAESAIVRWSNGSGVYGVEFVGVTPMTRVFLSRVVDYFERMSKTKPPA